MTPLGEKLLANEHAIMRALSCNNVDVLRQLVAPDVVFLTDQGYVWGDKIFELFSDLRVETFVIDQPHVVAAAADSAIVSYRLVQSGHFQGTAFASSTYSTSVWRETRDGWRVVFHQETPVAAPSPDA